MGTRQFCGIAPTASFLPSSGTVGRMLPGREAGLAPLGRSGLEVCPHGYLNLGRQCVSEARSPTRPQPWGFAPSRGPVLECWVSCGCKGAGRASKSRSAGPWNGCSAWSVCPQPGPPHSNRTKQTRIPTSMCCARLVFSTSCALGGTIPLTPQSQDVRDRYGVSNAKKDCVLLNASLTVPKNRFFFMHLP